MARARAGGAAIARGLAIAQSYHKICGTTPNVAERGRALALENPCVETAELSALWSAPTGVAATNGRQLWLRLPVLRWSPIAAGAAGSTTAPAVERPLPTPSRQRAPGGTTDDKVLGKADAPITIDRIRLAHLPALRRLPQPALPQLKEE